MLLSYEWNSGAQRYGWVQPVESLKLSEETQTVGLQVAFPDSGQYDATQRRQLPTRSHTITNSVKG